MTPQKVIHGPCIQALLPVNLLLATQVFGKEVWWFEMVWGGLEWFGSGLEVNLEWFGMVWGGLGWFGLA